MADDKKLRRDPKRDERRSKRLEILAKAAGGRTILSVKAGSTSNYVSEAQNERGKFGNDFAARVEACMEKPNGWLDQWLPEEGGMEPTLSDLEREIVNVLRALPNDVERGRALEKVESLLPQDPPPNHHLIGPNKADGVPR